MNIFCVPVVLAAAVILGSSVLPSSATHEENDLKFRGNDRYNNAWVKNFQILNTDQGLKAHQPPSPRSMEAMARTNNIPTFLQRQSTGTVMCEDTPTMYLLSLGQSVEFKSPNYPKKYPRNEDCGWLIGSNDLNVRIEITCSKFRLQAPKNKECFDYLALNKNVYCGKVINKWISTTNQVPIWFKSDKRKNFRGFSCKATAINASSIDPTECAANPLVNTLSLGASITLNTPRYPKKYPRNQLCGWYIQGEDWSVRVSVTCNRFKLQNPRGNKCPDYFSLPPNLYCGSNGPLGWLSSTSQTALFFSSNKKKQRKGFSCTATGVGPSSYGIGASTNCRCGQVNRATRIIGGQATQVNEYPWQVSLVERDTNRTLCGGSIINNRWILSAAHCPASTSNFQVVVGSHAWSNPPTSFQRLEYETYVYHPNYNYVTQDNDLVLVKLVDTLNFSNPAVAPICPPEPYSDYVGINATVTGWGYLSNDSTIQPDELQEVDVTTINHTDCVASYPDYVVTHNMLCAGHPDGGKDSCQGDSGGPLVTQEGDHYVQIGVVSWGVGCGEANHPGVYATIANQLTWINSVASGGETCPM